MACVVCEARAEQTGGTRRRRTCAAGRRPAGPTSQPRVAVSHLSCLVYCTGVVLVRVLCRTSSRTELERPLYCKASP